MRRCAMSNRDIPSKQESLPPWPNPQDFEFVANFDKHGNAYPLVGYQYKAEADYLRAWKAVAEARLKQPETGCAECVRLRNDILELTCGDPRRACPNCRGALEKKPICGWGGAYGRCVLEPDHDGPHDIPRHPKTPVQPTVPAVSPSIALEPASSPGSAAGTVPHVMPTVEKAPQT
jgi:hypothetical protein